MNKVCIIGCGMIAQSAHIPAYKQYSDDFEIVFTFLLQSLNFLPDVTILLS